MKLILNLTQHTASKEQLDAGVIEPTPDDKKVIIRLITFDKILTQMELRERAEILSKFVFDNYNTCDVMIGGAPYFMSHLEDACREHDINYFYSFSIRESVENVVNGEVVKTSVFKHVGFIGGE